MIRFLSFLLLFFSVCPCVLGQDAIPAENIDETNPLYIPTDSGFVFFAADEGKVIFARQLTKEPSVADSMIDTQAANGVVAVESEEGMEYFEYKQVDIDKLFGVNATKVRSYYYVRNLRPQDQKIKGYYHDGNYEMSPVDRPPKGTTLGWSSSYNRDSKYYYGRYKEDGLLVDYQFVVFEDKFAFYTSNSNHLVVFNQLGEVLSYSTLKPTEPFIYSKKHQSIYYDEVQQKFYLLNTTNFGYNWYVVEPTSGEAKLVHQIKRLFQNPNWNISDGTLFYTKEVSGEVEVFQVPLM